MGVLFELERHAHPAGLDRPGGAWVCAPAWETQSQQRKGRLPLRTSLPLVLTLLPLSISASLEAGEGEGTVRAGVKVKWGPSRGKQSNGNQLLKADGALWLLHSLHGCLLSAWTPGPALHRDQGHQTPLRRN